MRLDFKVFFLGDDKKSVFLVLNQEAIPKKKRRQQESNTNSVI